MDEIKNRVFTNVVKKELEDEVERVGTNISSILKKYSFFFGNNKEQLLEVLTKTYLSNYDNTTNSFYLDYELFLKSVPNESKDKLFESVIDNFSKTVKITDITKESNAEEIEEEIVFEETPSETPSETLEY